MPPSREGNLLYDAIAESFSMTPVLKGGNAQEAVDECRSNSSRVTYDSVMKFIKSGKEKDLVPKPRNRMDEEEEEEEAESRLRVSDEVVRENIKGHNRDGERIRL